MGAERTATPPLVDEKALVADFADTASLHGYKVTKHSVSHNHERDETSLSVSFVKASGAENQKVLKLAEDGHGNPEDGS